MEKIVLSIADISIAIHMEYPLESLAEPLSKLFSGYISKSNKVKYSITLSYDHMKTYPGLNTIPIKLNENVYRELTDRIRGMYPISNDFIMVGFQNGCLSYNRLSHTGHLLFFHTKKSHFIMGTLHKLLFIFIALMLAENKKFMVHGAGIEENSKGYLFLGESGAGKSTVAGFADERHILSDDAAIVGNDCGLFTMYPSPFGQVNLFSMKEENHHEKKILLTRLFFLKKNEKPSIAMKEKRYAFEEIMMKYIHAFEFMGRQERGDAFNLFYDMCNNIPAYNLYFQKNNQFWNDIAKIENNPVCADARLRCL